MPTLNTPQTATIVPELREHSFYSLYTRPADRRWHNPETDIAITIGAMTVTLGPEQRAQLVIALGGVVPQDCPVTVEMLRADWETDPSLAADVAAALQDLSDDDIANALETALDDRTWFSLLDSTRYDATSALLAKLGMDRRESA